MCDCLQLEDIINCGDDEQEEFIKPRGLRLRRKKRDAGLFVCPECGTYWNVDLGQRGPQAIKVTKPLGWEHFDDVPFRLKFLERFHGGVSAQRCLFRDCQKLALASIARR